MLSPALPPTQPHYFVLAVRALYDCCMAAHGHCQWATAYLAQRLASLQAVSGGLCYLTEHTTPSAKDDDQYHSFVVSQSDLLE